MIAYYKHSIEEHEHLYGPGKRFVIWVQGCSIRCIGCINKHMWAFNKDNLLDDDEFVSHVLVEDIEGITLLGGEPLDQAKQFLPVLKRIKDKGKTIVLFTGYLRKALFYQEQLKIWDMSDIVIGGPFELAKRNIHLQFRGSTNQRVYSKGRYQGYKTHDGSTVSVIDIHADGTMELKGFNSETIIPEQLTKRQKNRF